MVVRSNDAVQILLKPVGANGTHWVFVFRPDDVWEPGVDGTSLAVGGENRTSSSTGVRKFLSLTVAGAPQLAGECA